MTPFGHVAIYGGLLFSEAVTDTRQLVGREPRVHNMFVDYDGNSTDSGEEVQRIVAEIVALPGSEWIDERNSRPIGQSDVLVVAAYNAQVRMTRRHLESAGLREVLVGALDKFQGRLAPVVFFSPAASSFDDVSRGISFLLNRNRVNVAVSRAKYAAYIVRSPHLTEFLPSSPADLVALGAFLALSEDSRST